MDFSIKKYCRVCGETKPCSHLLKQSVLHKDNKIYCVFTADTEFEFIAADNIEIALYKYQFVRIGLMKYVENIILHNKTPYA